MTLTILFFILISAVIAYRRRARVPEALHTAVRRIVREARLTLGEYTLKMIMEGMIDDVFDGVLPSVTKSYVPNVVTFGLHPKDVRRWGAYFGELADELASLVAAATASRENLELCGSLKVTLVEDESAQPGRPTMRAEIRRDPTDRSPARRDVGTAEIATHVVRTRTTEALDDDSNEERAPNSWWGLRLRDDNGGRTIRLTEKMLVGRDKTAAVRLVEPGVSRRHARVAAVDGEVSIVDLDSSNGTFVNGERVMAGMLGSGDLLRFGPRAEAELIRVEYRA